ncbi:hypothetical protein ES288_D05G071200v1 [Gossypium darwinii]|nr:hypothetical protein ES288_D05G071200v1 [Gossypium darwinii]
MCPVSTRVYTFVYIPSPHPSLPHKQPNNTYSLTHLLAHRHQYHIENKMAGVWVFNNGVYRLENSLRRRVLVHLPSGEVVSSYSSLEHILRGLGWERYYGGDPDLYQFHKHSSIDLISLPKDFSKFCSVHMYDIVVKNPNVFHVRDM